MVWRGLAAGPPGGLGTARPMHNIAKRRARLSSDWAVPFACALLLCELGGVARAPYAGAGRLAVWLRLADGHSSMRGGYTLPPPREIS